MLKVGGEPDSPRVRKLYLTVGHLVSNGFPLTYASSFAGIGPKRITSCGQIWTKKEDRSLHCCHLDPPLPSPLYPPTIHPDLPMPAIYWQWSTSSTSVLAMMYNTSFVTIYCMHLLSMYVTDHAGKEKHRNASCYLTCWVLGLDVAIKCLRYIFFQHATSHRKACMHG